jgi:phosphoribosylpyrophosphate synthetase
MGLLLIAPALAEAISRIHNGKWIGALFHPFY